MGGRLGVEGWCCGQCTACREQEDVDVEGVDVDADAEVEVVDVEEEVDMDVGSGQHGRSTSWYMNRSSLMWTRRSTPGWRWP